MFETGHVWFAETAKNAPHIFGQNSFDAVLCHGVLPYLEDPEPLVRAMVRIAGPGAVISILTKNTDALAMRPGLSGNYREALAAFDTDRELNRLGLDTRADKISGIAALFEANGVDLEYWYGVRVFTDHIDDRPSGPDLSDVLEAEWEAGRRDPYRTVARLVHLVGRKRPG